jgi:hypothetical protein
MRFAIAAFAAFFLTPATARAADPRVVATTPDTGDIYVDPAVNQIKIVFDQPIDPRGRSIVGGGDAFPQITGDITWTNNKTLIIPVALQANHQYWLSINSDTFKNFRNNAGEPVEWYPIFFKTLAPGALAPHDLTPQQNANAVAALKAAIDEDYSYRDRLKVNWDHQIDQRKTQFASANNANEFARATAHLLRQARDPHVSVRANDIAIGTCTTSASPNFSFRVLANTVPQWEEHPHRVYTGRFDGGIGYITFPSCDKDTADAFDAAMSKLADTNALVLDARVNGGGDEDAAAHVAGRFVARPAVYAKDRIRENGQWTAALDRIVKPRTDIPPYTHPVIVLIGPKVMSSAESFVLMMRCGAGAKLFGDTTRGASGRPMPHDLGNGVTVYLPSWEDQLPNGTILEGKGIKPDVFIKTTPAELTRHDPILEKAVELLQAHAALDQQQTKSLP